MRCALKGRSARTPKGSRINPKDIGPVAAQAATASMVGPRGCSWWRAPAPGPVAGLCRSTRYVASSGPRSPVDVLLRQRDVQLQLEVLAIPAYVLHHLVIHQLAYLQHRDHSARFWRVVEAVMPGWKAHADWLSAAGAPRRTAPARTVSRHRSRQPSLPRALREVGVFSQQTLAKRPLRTVTSTELWQYRGTGIRPHLSSGEIGIFEVHAIRQPTAFRRGPARNRGTLARNMTGVPSWLTYFLRLSRAKFLPSGTCFGLSSNPRSSKPLTRICGG